MMTDQQDSQTAALVEAGRWLLAQGTEFKFGVVALEALPAPDRIEDCLCRTLKCRQVIVDQCADRHQRIGAHLQYAGTHTRAEFFLLAPQRNDGAAWLVDLPGYGYARESKAKIAAWNKLLNAYLRGRPNLRRIFMLVDSRHGLKEKRSRNDG